MGEVQGLRPEEDTIRSKLLGEGDQHGLESPVREGMWLGLRGFAALRAQENYVGRVIVRITDDGPGEVKRSHSFFGGDKEEGGKDGRVRDDLRPCCVTALYPFGNIRRHFSFFGGWATQRDESVGVRST